MAANLQSFKLASFVKRFVSRISSHDSLIASSFSIRRGVHDSIYNKNPEELAQESAHSTIVPDNVIPPQPEKYWAPHPETGVFGPATDKNFTIVEITRNVGSALDQKAFFRLLEDLDKPEVQH